MPESLLEWRLLGFLNAGALGLHPGRVKIERVLNWGNFETASFHVSDGDQDLHIKLAESAAQSGMRLWQTCGGILTSRYHAPPVVAWIDVPGSNRGGLVFPHIPGSTWNPLEQPELLRTLLPIFDRLHADGELAALLTGTPRTYATCWDLRYRDQYLGDLEVLRNNPPPFLSSAVLDWMGKEATTVLSLPENMTAFAQATDHPCHWDVWGGNVLLSPEGPACILDWDDLAIGDPALDFAALVWPLLENGDAAFEDIPYVATRDPNFPVRTKLHFRALTLDYLIDVLADWVECEHSPWCDAVRPKKAAQHHEFLDFYRSRW